MNEFYRHVEVKKDLYDMYKHVKVQPCHGFNVFISRGVISLFMIKLVSKKNPQHIDL